MTISKKRTCRKLFDMMNRFSRLSLLCVIGHIAWDTINQQTNTHMHVNPHYCRAFYCTEPRCTFRSRVHCTHAHSSRSMRDKLEAYTSTHPCSCACAYNHVQTSRTRLRPRSHFFRRLHTQYKRAHDDQRCGGALASVQITRECYRVFALNEYSYPSVTLWLCITAGSHAHMQELSWN